METAIWPDWRQQRDLQSLFTRAATSKRNSICDSRTQGFRQLSCEREVLLGAAQQGRSSMEMNELMYTPRWPNPEQHKLQQESKCKKVLSALTVSCSNHCQQAARTAIRPQEAEEDGLVGQMCSHGRISENF